MRTENEIRTDKLTRQLELAESCIFAIIDAMITLGREKPLTIGSEQAKLWRNIMYKSPIEITTTPMRMEFDDGIWKTVQDYAVSVDKEELIKALRYDRDQYDKGYADGLQACPWISVESNNKPRHLQNCFIAYVYGEGGMTFFGEARYHAFEGNGFVNGPHFSNEGVEGMRVTHWMPIPKLPKKEDRR